MADRNGYIGRAPGDSSVVVARQTFSPTGIQTDFTFASGYVVGYLDLYLNGARLIEGQDFTATDGSVVGLTTYAQNGDVLELVAYKAFNATNVQSAGGDFSVGGNLTVVGYTTANTYYGDGSNLTGITAGYWEKTDAGINTTSSVGIGTTNPDQTLEVHTQSGTNLVKVSTKANSTLGIELEKTGATTQSWRIADGQTVNGKLEFYDATDATTRMCLDGEGRLLVGDSYTSSQSSFYTGRIQVQGTNSSNSAILIKTNQNDSGSCALVLAKSRGTTVGSNTIVQDGDEIGIILFNAADGTDVASRTAHIASQVDGLVGVNSTPGRLQFSTTPSNAATPVERLRIDSSGRFLYGNGSSGGYALFDNSDTNPKFQFRQTSGEPRGAAFIEDRGDANGFNFYIAKSRGGNGTTVVNSGDTLGSIRFTGADGTNQVTGAQILATVNAGVGADDMPSSLLFSTNSGTTSPTERLRIANTGAFGLSGTNYGTAGQVITSNGSGSAPTWQDASGGGGITTEAATPSNAVVQINLTDATDHKITATGICTITSTTAGTEGQSHTIRIVNSGIATVGFSTYFLFPSGSVPSLPTADGAVSIISFTVHDSVGAGCTQLLAGASVNFS